MTRQINQHYGWISIILHWTVAGLVIWLFLSGQQIEHAESRDIKRPLVLLHNSIGVLLVISALIRTALRGANGMAPRTEQHAIFKVLAATVPWILLVLILVIIGSGITTWWAVGNPVKFFTLFEIPSPLSRNMELHEQAEAVHALTSHLIIPLVLLHVLGALKHLVINRDGVFTRIFIPKELGPKELNKD